MNSGNATQIAVAVVLTLTLAAVLWYACEARKQAKASAEMAQEMRQTRYDALRPVLSIWPDAKGAELSALAEAARESHGPLWLRASISNEGRGPALKVAYTMWDSQNGVGVPGEEGILAAGRSIGPQELEARRTHEDADADVAGVVIVKYEDVFGRPFESRLRITREGRFESVDVRGPR